MGGSVSSAADQDIFLEGSSYNPTSIPKCPGINNDDIAYRTKQFVVLRKAIDVIGQIAEGKRANLDLSDPSEYLIDTSQIIPDLEPGIIPTITSLNIFEPKKKIVGVRNGIPQQKLFTVIDQYNNYFLNDYAIIESQEGKVNRAKIIHDNLVLAMENSFNYLMNVCNDIGKIDKNVFIFGPNTSSTKSLKGLISEAIVNADSNPQKTQEIMNTISRGVNAEIMKEVETSVNAREITPALQTYLQ